MTRLASELADYRADAEIFFASPKKGNEAMFDRVVELLKPFEAAISEGFFDPELQEEVSVPSIPTSGES